MPLLQLVPVNALTFIARGLCALPPSVQHALGGGPVVVDGQTLETELILLMRVSERVAQTRPDSMPIFRARQGRAARIGGGMPDDSPSRDLTIPGPAGSMRARHYVAHEAAAPLVVFFHGGGFVYGDLDTHDAACRLLSRHARAHVLSVEYRLAPEHPFPAAVEDTFAAFRWAHDHAREFGADPTRVAVAGDSAGGNLAAVVSLMAARDGGPRPVAQMLLYPAIDRVRDWPSLDQFGDGYYLTRESIDWFNAQYAEGVPNSDPRLNPLSASDLSDLPPALVVTAGFDPLRDEGEAYADALARAGTSVMLRRFGGLVHGFFSMGGISPACRDAIVDVAASLRMMLERIPS